MRSLSRDVRVNLAAVFAAMGSVFGYHTSVSVLGRAAHVYEPKGPRRGKAAAVLVLHGSGGAASDMYGIGFEPLADGHGFLVVYPEMASPRADEWGYRADVPYFRALVERLGGDARFGLDPGRVFVCGHSAGGTMSLFLQNELDDLFAAGGAVEAAVGKLQEWDMSRAGCRTMVIWNHADPVLEEYAPEGGEPAYYKLTVSTLRRHGSQEPASTEALPTSGAVDFAELRAFAAEGDACPELRVLSWESRPGTHSWPRKPAFTFDGAEELCRFFLGEGGAVV